MQQQQRGTCALTSNNTMAFYNIMTCRAAALNSPTHAATATTNKNVEQSSCQQQQQPAPPVGQRLQHPSHAQSQSPLPWQRDSWNNCDPGESIPVDLEGFEPEQRLRQCFVSEWWFLTRCSFLKGAFASFFSQWSELGEHSICMRSFQAPAEILLRWRQTVLPSGNARPVTWFCTGLWTCEGATPGVAHYSLCSLVQPGFYRPHRGASVGQQGIKRPRS